MPPSFDPDLSRLDDFLADRGLDAYLVDADATDSDQRYLSGYDAPDPYVTLYGDGEAALLVSGLEYARAERTARADAVCRLADYGFQEKAEDLGRAEARRAVVAAFCADFGVESVAVPDRFPLGTADGLREREVRVTVDDEEVVGDIRAVKTDPEIEHVERAQRANEAAMRAAEELLADAEVEDGTLHRGDDPLTSERVKEEIEVTLLRHGCGLDETIVASGTDAAEPHERGSGPIGADDPVIVDIFPRDKETKYHADMTRTFCRGTPDEAVEEFYAATEAALDAALDAIEPGATGEAVHDAACDVYEERGYPTLRSDESAETGFIHSTGHGVGLDVHELPRLGPGGEELEPGHVVTVEPGLYDPDVGGVRIEDLVVVTEDGYRNLTDYGREWVL
jgi:Xaa-Pro aminopeptidase